MPHVDEGTLHAYLDGAIDALVAAGALSADTSRADIESHLAACGDCRSLYEAERSVRERAGVVLRAAAPGPIVVPPFAEIRSEWVPRTPEIFDRPRSYIPLAWAASVLLAVGAGWFGSAAWRDANVDGNTALTQASEQAVPDARLSQDAPTGAPQIRNFGAPATPGLQVAGVPERFRAAVDSARNDGLTWRNVAVSDPLAQALGVVNVEGAEDMSVAIARLPGDLGSIARVQQRLDTGEPFELLVWREPVEVAAALDVQRRQLALAEIDGRQFSPTAARAREERAAPRWPAVAVLASHELPEGESRVLARVRDEMTYVAIHGPIERERLTGLAGRLVEIH